MFDYKDIIDTCEKLKDKNFKYKNIDDVYKDLQDIENCLKACRNELCNQCGKYKVYDGFNWCNECRWRV